MSHSPDNPFSNYQPPAFDAIFSPAGRIALVEFKVERLAERVKRDMLEGYRVEQFIEGSYDHAVNYNCASLEPLITFPNPEDELDFVGKAVATGLCAAMQARKISDPTGALGMAQRFSDENPRVANITARFFRD